MTKLKSLILGVSTAASLMAFSPAFAATTAYKIEPTHTSVDIQYWHQGFARSTIRFMSASGTVALDHDDLTKSTVDIVIDTTKVNSGVPLFDQHLAEEALFSTAKFPTATFKSTKVTLTSKTTADVEGDLTIKGVTKPIVLKTTFNKRGIHPYARKDTVGFSATATLYRSHFNMGKAVPFVGDLMDLDIQVEAIAEK